MVWDGLGFFGIFDDSKIARFQGEKVTWLTPFSSCKNNFLLVLVLTISAYVIIKEASKVGKEKSQTINLTRNEEYFYKVD
jgi:hypothetical protein